jgi:hypothetical protein
VLAPNVFRDGRLPWCLTDTMAHEALHGVFAIYPVVVDYASEEKNACEHLGQGVHETMLIRLAGVLVICFLSLFRSMRPRGSLPTENTRRCFFVSSNSGAR